MSQLNPTASDDIDIDIDVDVDAETGPVSAQEDAYDLYDRSALYAKAEQSYSNKELSQEWARPASSSSEVGADKIQGFDSFDDHTDRSMDSLQNPNDIHKGHPPPDRSCLPKDLDLSSLLMKERRTKKFLILLCLFLSVGCIALLCNPRKYISDESMNDPALRSSSGQSAYNMLGDNTYAVEGISADSSNAHIIDASEVGMGDYATSGGEDGIPTNPDNEGATIEYIQPPMTDTVGSSNSVYNMNPPPMVNIGIETKFRTIENFSQPQAKDDLPILWSIPKSGSDLVQDVMMQCFNLVVASNEGDISKNEPIAAFTMGGTQNTEGQSVNVDVTTVDGINDAVKKDLVGSNISSAIATPLINEAAALFTGVNLPEGQPEQLGECFVILRDPIDRAIAVFSQLQTSAHWAKVDIVTYAKGAEIENNWMTRALTGKLNGGDLTEDDLSAAKEFLENYCVVGTLDELAESVRQFANAFGWKTNDEQADKFSPCVANALRNGLMDERLMYQHNTPGEYLHELLSNSNNYDTQLYAWGQQLAESR